MGTKTMRDSITVADLQLAAQNGDPVPDAFGGYDDGIYANVAQIQAVYPNVPVLDITVFSSDNTGDCLDVENGDATPAEAPGWVVDRRNAGHTWPTVYCSESVYNDVVAAFNGAGVAQPLYWVAGYPGSVGPVVYPWPNVIGHQWVDRGPYDESVMLDTYPLFGQAPPAPPAPPAPIEEEDDMTRHVYAANGDLHVFGVSPNAGFEGVLVDYVYKQGKGLPTANNVSAMVAFIGGTSMPLTRIVDCWLGPDKCVYVAGYDGFGIPIRYALVAAKSISSTSPSFWVSENMFTDAGSSAYGGFNS